MPGALWNTIAYTIVVVPISMVLALLIAQGLNQKIRGLGFFRTVYYQPVVTARSPPRRSGCGFTIRTQA